MSKKVKEQLVGLTKTGPFMRQVCVDFLRGLASLRLDAAERGLEIKCSDFSSTKGGNIVSLHVRVCRNGLLVVEYWPATGNYVSHLTGTKGKVGSSKGVLPLALRELESGIPTRCGEVSY